MKKQIAFYGVIATLFCSTLLLSGCTQQNSTSSPESLQAILEKAIIIESVSYELEIVMTVADEPIQYKKMVIWEKEPFLKQQEDTTAGNITTTLLIIKRAEGLYRYDDVLQTYEFDPEGVVLHPTIIETVHDLIQNQTVTILGIESIDGMTTTVIQYTPRDMGNTTTKTLWIWKEKGVPVKERSVTTTEELTVTIDTTYMNYSFSDIPENVFSVE
jgi:outer membrane lipoprotein-sorting protein